MRQWYKMPVLVLNGCFRLIDYFPEFHILSDMHSVLSDPGNTFLTNSAAFTVGLIQKVFFILDTDLGRGGPVHYQWIRIEIQFHILGCEGVGVP